MVGVADREIGCAMRSSTAGLVISSSSAALKLTAT